MKTRILHLQRKAILAVSALVLVGVFAVSLFSGVHSDSVRITGTQPDSVRITSVRITADPQNRDW